MIFEFDKLIQKLPSLPQKYKYRFFWSSLLNLEVAVLKVIDDGQLVSKSSSDAKSLAPFSRFALDQRLFVLNSHGVLNFLSGSSFFAGLDGTHRKEGSSTPRSANSLKDLAYSSHSFSSIWLTLNSILFH